jgi:hypothetical protein
MVMSNLLTDIATLRARARAHIDRRADDSSTLLEDVGVA